ncbi:zinc ribbon domain-containing protein [Oceanobacillus bengalensis]|uniref:zinc ribbon domain-containing protein n=1 Tax=Oceanobacillus bengalensis TaxID=1435466 RepID=UPI0024823E5E|nr:zinc ribbon domain-containing protein [Oceanobacillus bengalensis]
MFCAECEDVFRRVHWNNRGYRSIVWRCVSRLERKTHLCNAETIREDDLQNAIVLAINEVLGSKDSYLSILVENIETVLNENADKPTADIDEKLKELQMELLRLANSKADYDEVAEEIYRLRELKQDVLLKNAEREGMRQRVEEMTKFSIEQPQQIEVYDDLLVRRLIEKITIHGRKLTIEFKSGIAIKKLI